VVVKKKKKEAFGQTTNIYTKKATKNTLKWSFSILKKNFRLEIGINFTLPNEFEIILLLKENPNPRYLMNTRVASARHTYIIM
jgi:hypothetical protein